MHRGEVIQRQEDSHLHAKEKSLEEIFSSKYSEGNNPAYNLISKLQTPELWEN